MIENVLLTVYRSSDQKIFDKTLTYCFKSLLLDALKDTLWRFENLLICLYLYKNNNLKILHPLSGEFYSYLLMKSVNFLKSR